MIKRDIESILRILSRQWASFKKEWSAWLVVRSLKDGLKKYVPKYALRHGGEHDEIRRMIRPIPPCQHLKGGRRPALVKDYNVSKHIFIDGTVRIICNSCRKKWFKESTDWIEAERMVRESSNRMSRSEIPSKNSPCNNSELLGYDTTPLPRE